MSVISSILGIVAAIAAPIGAWFLWRILKPHWQAWMSAQQAKENARELEELAKRNEAANKEREKQGKSREDIWDELNKPKA